jgi:hypothetical protein
LDFLSIVCTCIQAKRAIQEQLELSRQLTEKQDVHTDSEEEEGNKAEEAKDEPCSTFGSLIAHKDNPWGIDTTVQQKTTTASHQNTGNCYVVLLHTLSNFKAMMKVQGS